MSVHELQAKAFLVASEDVDIDQEIIEDILKGLDHDIAAVTGQEDEDGSSLSDDGFEGELDISALFANALDGDTISIMSNDFTTYSFRCIPNR